jgi:hypothetical protein
MMDRRTRHRQSQSILPKLSLFFPVLVLKSLNSIGTARKNKKTNAN